MYNEWLSNEVATHLNQSVHPSELKITSKVSDLKPLHASWIVDRYEHLKKRISDDHERITETIMFNLFTRKSKIVFEVPKLCFLIKKRVGY